MLSLYRGFSSFLKTVNSLTKFGMEVPGKEAEPGTSVQQKSNKMRLGGYKKITRFSLNIIYSG
jgi:hypothetical protein